jgi:1,4-alpha-glucan branching enzyme
MVRLVYAPSDPEVAGVAVAGTFNGWNPDRTLMQRQGNLWTTQLVLPRDVYEYVFVIDGEEWVTDPLALETRDDGFGRENAVLDLTM